MTDINAKQKKLFPDTDNTNLDAFLAKQKKLFDQLEEKAHISYSPQYENLVNFQEASTTPIQRWFSYREGYSSKLISDFIKEKNITGNILDPFCGSGSTLLSARQNNLPSLGLDINPYPTLIAKVSNQNYTATEKDLLSGKLEQFKNLDFKESDRKINFNLIDKVFNDQILDSLLCIRDEIDEIKNDKIKNLFFGTWLSILERVSNVKKEGNGIKYLFTKRTKDGYKNLDQEKWEENYFPEDKFAFVKHTFIEVVEKIKYDINNRYGSTSSEPVIKNTNCIDFDYDQYDNFELTYFSPPYCNAFDYFEIHKVELWMGEFVNSKSDLLNLKRSGFRSNTTSLGRKGISYKNKYITELTDLLQSRDLWDDRLIDVVGGYFDDMHSLLNKLYENTVQNGYVAIVVGNSAYSGCIIPTDLLVGDIGRRVGFNLEETAKVRHLTTSSQQKKYLEPIDHYLRESIILLKK